MRPAHHTLRLSLALAAAILLAGPPAPGGRPGGAPPSGARNATAVELQNLDTALSLAALDTGVYHTLENLDDLPAGTATFHPFDDIDAAGAGTPVLLPSTGRFAAARRHYTGGAGLPWRGPYAAFQQGRIELGPAITYDEGSPLDQWGNPYRLYSPLGLVDPRTESIVLDAIGDRFDRWAIVTAGPDGLLDTADDAVRQFGGAPTATVVSSILLTPIPADLAPFAEPELAPDSGRPDDRTTARPRTPSPAAATLLVRGYNFGATQGTTRLLVGDTDLGTAASWSDRAILLARPAGVAGATLRLVRGGTTIDEFPLP